MNKKNLYVAPKVEVLEMELEGIIAISPGGGDINIDEGTHGGGDSMSKGFWD